MAVKFNPFTGKLDLVNNPGGGTATVSFLSDSGTATPTALGQISIVGGDGVETTAASNTLTIDVVNGGYNWVDVSGISDDIEIQTGYHTSNLALTTLTLPISFPIYGVFRVICLGAGLVRIAQRAGQTIKFGVLDTTVGVTGYIESTNIGDCVEITCTASNTDFCVLSSMGNWSIN